MIDILIKSLWTDGDTMDILGESLDGRYTMSAGVWVTAAWQHYTLTIMDTVHHKEQWRTDQRVMQPSRSDRECHSALHLYLLTQCLDLL